MALVSPSPQVFTAGFVRSVCIVVVLVAVLRTFSRTSSDVPSRKDASFDQNKLRSSAREQPTRMVDFAQQVSIVQEDAVATTPSSPEGQQAEPTKAENFASEKKTDEEMEGVKPAPDVESEKGRTKSEEQATFEVDRLQKEEHAKATEKAVLEEQLRQERVRIAAKEEAQRQKEAHPMGNIFAAPSGSGMVEDAKSRAEERTAVSGKNQQEDERVNVEATKQEVEVAVEMEATVREETPNDEATRPKDEETVKNEAFGKREEQHEDEREAEVPAAATQPARRRFLKYTSSLWENMWLENIAEWEKNREICQRIEDDQQRPFLLSFLKTLCTHVFADTTWCAVYDTENLFWFNTETGQMMKNPDDHPPVPFKDWSSLLASKPPQQIEMNEPDSGDSEAPQVFSRFDFVDDLTGNVYSEYIEPLVSHLRHPLSYCSHRGVVDRFDRSFVVPPPSGSFEKSPRKLYFDAVATRWGQKGSSLAFFTNVWERYGMDFDEIHTWNVVMSHDVFYDTVPTKYKDRTFYRQQWITGTPGMDRVGNGDVLDAIKKKARKEDYVLFKLDLSDGPIEKTIASRLLSNTDDITDYVDEFVWEHHAGGNYLLRGDWGQGIKPDETTTLHQSYQYFLDLRRKGVRAHSWV